MTNTEPAREIFPIPIEARYIRFNPQTWRRAIAMRVGIIGCGEATTVTIPPTVPGILKRLSLIFIREEQFKTIITFS